MRVSTVLVGIGVLLFVISPTSLLADPNFAIPSMVAPTHLDLNPVGQWDLIPAFGGVPAMPNPAVGGPSGTFVTGEWVRFQDNLNAPDKPWHWETELYNPNAGGMTFTAGWYWPGGSAAYNITLPVAGSFYLDVVWNEAPETGNWVWGCASWLRQAIGVDTSVVETDGTPGLIVKAVAGVQWNPKAATGDEDIRYGGQCSPPPANFVPPCWSVPGKEYSNHLDKSAPGGQLDPLQNIHFDCLGTCTDTFDYSGSGVEDIEVDALANSRDALFHPVVQDRVPLLASFAGYADIRYQMAKVDTVGIWTKPCTQLPTDDVDGLEIWGPCEEPEADDANMFSLDGDPGGIAVWRYDPVNHVSVPYITTAMLQYAIETTEDIDLDALMVWDADDDDEFSPGDSIMFSIEAIGQFDGGEIWVWTSGSPAVFLIHGGEVWNTAHAVGLHWGVNTEEINALEAVPEPATMVLLAIGGLGILLCRKRK